MRPILTASLKVETLQIPIADLPTSLNGTTIVQLSDLHYDGTRLEASLLEQAIAATNAADPDFVVITGDFVTDRPDPICPLSHYLKQINAPTYGILGNHDLCPGSKTKIIQTLATIGIPILWNQVVYPLGAELALVGLADYWSTDYRQVGPVMESIPQHIPRLVLAHNPDCAHSLQQWRVDLQLSGHSHGGQMILPGLGNLAVLNAALYPHLPKVIKRRFPVLGVCHRVMEHWQWVKGLHQVGNNWLYVNRGLGSYFPGRLFCPPEVTIITLMQFPSEKISPAPCARRTGEMGEGYAGNT